MPATKHTPKYKLDTSDLREANIVYITENKSGGRRIATCSGKAPFDTAKELLSAAHSKQPLIDALTDCLRVIEDFMPHIGRCALQDYQLLNEAPIRAKNAIRDARQ